MLSFPTAGGEHSGNNGWWVGESLDPGQVLLGDGTGNDCVSGPSPGVPLPASPHPSCGPPSQWSTSYPNSAGAWGSKAEASHGEIS